MTGAVDTGETNRSRGTDGFRPALDETEVTGGCKEGLLGGIGLGRFCFFGAEPPVPVPDFGRFLEVEEDEGASSLGRSATELTEELNLDGVSDPRSVTSCGLVHFE